MTRDPTITIIGAGVIGLAVAWELSKKFEDVFVLEKKKTFGQETSSRNSEVIHGGMYYPSGSLKAKLCVEGRHLLYELCKKQMIPHNRMGKLIVATEKEEINVLENLFKLGEANGVEGLRMLDRKELKVLEPNVEGLAALYSPETGILDTHCLMQYFYDHAKSNGAIVAFNSEVTGIEKTFDAYSISVRNGRDLTALGTDMVINCAGLDSDTVAEMAGMGVDKLNYRLRYCKGQYFRVNSSKSRLINRLVYPVPKPKSGGLGIHATLDLAGSMRLGPDDEYLDNRNKDYSVKDAKKGDFYASARKFMPFLEEEDLIPDTAGIRPKLQGNGVDFRDFVIEDETGHGFAGFINLIGIESPGFTCSLAIGQMVRKLIKNGTVPAQL
ncbi:MAG: NAD(P)/FAD-dependent oxidoreductase [Candidatus Omnitrophica bacterium]|nr:NAD(P)/FAD-dependent oxidoreductase [Candidatus Omnitrophota bacterium]